MFSFRNEEISQTSLERRVRRYWEQTAYITDAEVSERMRTYLTQSKVAAESGDLQTAHDAFLQAKREYILARKNRQIYYWRSWPGMIAALFLLLLFCGAVVIVFTFRNSLQSSQLLLIVAGLGGGIGGCVAVLLNVINVDPNSEVVSKAPWYVIKPILGAALGMVTYLAVALGVDVLSKNGSVDSLEGATVIGFLAGFFESFSKGVLARFAGQYAADEKGTKEATQSQKANREKGVLKNSDDKGFDA